jgi:[methyl-Co(III) methanol-specific corrinoid protein]:coenzyme M methyltransferase
MGPWTLSYHLHGVEDTLIDSIEEHDKIREFIEKFSEVTKTFAQAQFEAGADVLTLADHATADLVSPGTYQEILLPAHKKIIQFFHGQKLILHCCGNTLDRIALFAQAGFTAFHFDSKNDINKAIKEAGNMKLTGCVNNIDVLLNGNQETVASQVENIIDSGINIVSPECAIPLQVKNVNLAEIVNTVQKFTAQKKEAGKRFLETVEDMQKESIINGTSDMTMDEINTIIAECRQEKNNAE